MREACREPRPSKNLPVFCEWRGTTRLSPGREPLMVVKSGKLPVHLIALLFDLLTDFLHVLA